MFAYVRKSTWFTILAHFIEFSAVACLSAYYFIGYRQIPPEQYDKSLYNLFFAFSYFYALSNISTAVKLLDACRYYQKEIYDSIWLHRQTLNAKFCFPLKFLNIIIVGLGLSIFITLLVNLKFKSNPCDCYPELNSLNYTCSGLWAAGLTGLILFPLEIWFFRTNTLVFILSYLKRGEHCDICMKKDRFPKQELACGHKSHSNCLTQWKEYSDKCPICNKVYDIEVGTSLKAISG